MYCVVQVPPQRFPSKPHQGQNIWKDMRAPYWVTYCYMHSKVSLRETLRQYTYNVANKVEWRNAQGIWFKLTNKTIQMLTNIQYHIERAT